MTGRQYSLIDSLIMDLDRLLETVTPPAKRAERPYPAENIKENLLNPREKQQSAALMRINHAGEISAQALYLAQALTAKDSRVKTAMQTSANEEIDHLVWCERRIKELGGHTSYLGPFWFLGSFIIGMAAGTAGDKWNLGFVAETEHQVVKHLDGHLNRLSRIDNRSRAIIEQMKVDEAHHASVAVQSGAREMPQPVKKLMVLMSGVMTGTAYWV